MLAEKFYEHNKELQNRARERKLEVEMANEHEWIVPDEIQPDLFHTVFVASMIDGEMMQIACTCANGDFAIKRPCIHGLRVIRRIRGSDALLAAALKRPEPVTH